MKKIDYFAFLEGLSNSADEAVGLCSARHGARKSQRLCELVLEVDRSVCELESALFSDFIPPLQRENIATLAHLLRRVTELAVEHALTCAHVQKSDEERFCVSLMEIVSDGVKKLRDFRLPEVLPDREKFSQTNRAASEARAKYLAQTGHGAPRARAEYASSLFHLRREISLCFDGLVEIMLQNI